MSRVLLVIGNGFDRKLNVKSSYSDYLNSDYYCETRSKIQSLVDKYNTVVNQNYPEILVNFVKYNFDIFDDLTIWDIYFGFPYYCKENNIKNWCDFEDELYNFFFSRSGLKGILGLAQAKAQLIENNKMYLNTLLYVYLAKKGFTTDFVHVSYVRLLDELKLFEKKFGLYIKSLTGSDDYKYNSKQLALKIAGTNSIAKLDSFNYSEIEIDDYITRHINGNYDCPIFGIDDKELKPDDGAYIFTKTYRRLELSGNNKLMPKSKNYSKVIVYGHSINKQDYSYYYPVFNKLGFRNDAVNDNDIQIIFKYSSHDNKSAEEVKIELIKNVINLIYAYNKEVLQEDNNFRLLDILYSENKILFEELKDY